MLAKLAVLAVAGSLAALAIGGCTEDPACGVCDDKNLVVQILAGPNYANEQVRIVSPECEGPRCPSPFNRASYFIESIGVCEETDAAVASVRGVEEYCKIAPVVVSSGLQFVFNNLLDASYIETIRNRPDNPNLFETYDWKTRILSLHGPITRYAGDWRNDVASGKHRMTRGVNLTCAEQQLPAECAGLVTIEEGGKYSLVPERVALHSTIGATRGQWDDRAIGEAAAMDCETPDEGADTCCSQCDWSLGVAVAKYGAGERITCDPLGDRLIDCRGFQVAVDRRDEPACEEHPDDPWCAAQAVPLADRLRELHPSERIDALAERKGHACASNSECRDLAGIGLVGAECIGTNGEGLDCALDVGDPDCDGGHCRVPWFVDCIADPDTTGVTGYCVDVRHDSDAAAACYVLPDDTRLSLCDADADGELTAAECCGGGTCDPVYDTGVTPLARYERKATLPDVARAASCDDRFEDAQCTGEWNEHCECHEIGGRLTCSVCGQIHVDPDNQPDLVESRCAVCRDAGSATPKCVDCLDDGKDCHECSDSQSNSCLAQPEVRGVIAQTCDEDEHARKVYAVNFVTKLGGVIYDPALKGIEWRPADLGGTPRAVVEACAEERGLIAARNVADGWRAHDEDGLSVERDGEWDLGMCSSSRYEVVFADRGKHEEYLRDKVGNTLEGKNKYVFHTPDFHVVPDSGFPTDSLRIGACDTFSLSFSNKYDLSPGNLDKIVLLEGETPVAGGPGCARDASDLAARAGALPCLSIDVSDQPRGVVHARIDPVQFGTVLQPGHQYQLHAPGLDVPLPRGAETRPDVAAWLAGDYPNAFWDVCGMPLVDTYWDETQKLQLPEYTYAFTIDEPRCEDDEDGDLVQLSCDNAPEIYNPTQLDADFDGVGDAVDPCPASPEIAAETGDSDRDGVGNGCDDCARAPNRYNELAGALALPPELLVRNLPYQGDADEDGIGDACDNCPTVANCGGYDVAHPWRLGDPIDLDSGTCQRDEDVPDMVGDACATLETDGAAGPIGLASTDDFDQDGIANQFDACPRQPELDVVLCDVDACPDGRVCEDGDLDPGTPARCDHLDSDGDGIGNICDSCPASPNPEQWVEGMMQEDDADGDFIGLACELGDGCESEAGPRPLAFHAIASEGACCTTLLVADGDALYERATARPLVDPDGLPVRLNCTDASCRALPTTLADLPGVLVPPPGCDEALAAAGMTIADNVPLQRDATQGDLDTLWNLQCRLPPLDQDYDGLGDVCDLCPFAFDPANTPYTDATGKLWPHDGAACSGAHAAADDCEAPGAGDESGDESGGSSSSGE